MGENSFTVDLITDIISRLSAKNLVRFTCVSKSWCSLIRTDPYFARLHRTASPHRHCLFIKEIIPSVPELPYRFNRTSSIYNCWIDLESVEDQSISLIEIHNPFSCGNACVIASCRGLLVLGQRHDCQYNIAVYNPITRTHVMVPPNPAGDDNASFFGFGYDRVHDCYKLLTRVIHRDRRLDLMVYNLGKGTWKSLDFGMWWKSLLKEKGTYIDYCNWNLCDAKCADGAVYRFLEMDNTRMLVCFLLAEEEFHVVKPPEVSEGMFYLPHEITVFDGKLGFMCRWGEHEFWSLAMDYGEDGKRKWQWTKSLVIWDTLNYFNHYVSLTPVCYSACKNKILILSSQGNQFFWYDIVTREFNKVNDPSNGRRQEGQLFWFDIVKKEANKLNIPIFEGCFDDKYFAKISVI